MINNLRQRMLLIEAGSADWRQEEHVYKLHLAAELQYPRLDLNRAERRLRDRVCTVRKAALALPEIQAPVADLIPTQNWVHRPDVDKLLATAPKIVTQAREPVIIVRKDGHLFVEDGHHRLVAALLSGQPTLTGRLLDLDG